MQDNSGAKQVNPENKNTQSAQTGNNNFLNDLTSTNNKQLLHELHAKYHIELEQLKELGNLSTKNNKSVISLLLETSLLSKEKLNQITNEQYGLSVMEFDELDTKDIPYKYTNNELLDKYEAAPVFEKKGHLYIAVNDPNDYTSLSAYQFQTGLNTQAMLMHRNDINKLKKFIKAQIINKDLSFINFNELSSDLAGSEDIQNSPLVKYINKILLEALKNKASDIHFEPYKDKLRIRFRCDGLLTEIANLPIDNANQINSRLKVMSNLDISEKRIPQDGRFNFNADGKTFDFRMSTCPTLFGEKIVVRILDPTKAQMGIDDLGYEEDQKELFLKALNKSQGIIIVTGPTGSGKTISLYTALNILNTNSRNISTAEDPIEIYLPGINQVQVNNKIGLTFASALRCFLRQDPDVMMVGEIRDLETAEIAIKAAQTGHLVLSTLHTNSASETLGRLISMGIPSYNMATAISMIIAQRLIRKLCNNCKIVEQLPAEVLTQENFPKEFIDDSNEIFKANPNNCENCHSGYAGRIGIYETMLISKEMQEIILNGGSAIDIKRQATIENILSLRQAGLRKVAKGVTSLSEVNRVTKNA
ncbi:MAG: type IV-A pilus assembly ATPase PilB [Gammaproteobacteria bacterium]|nr:type IV-A pilus assembly ATPase PilB [Gammaproteobacteria bacterium]